MQRAFGQEGYFGLSLVVVNSSIACACENRVTDSVPNEESRKKTSKMLRRRHAVNAEHNKTAVFNLVKDRATQQTAAVPQQ